jgi:integrase
VRQGVLTEEIYRELMRELPDYQKPLWCFAYYTGIRQGALRKIERSMTTGWRESGGILVNPFSVKERVVKNGDPIFVPLYMPQMREFLQMALDGGDPKCPYLFQYKGRQISKESLYCAYKSVAEKLGIPELLFHDTRRTAVCSMMAAGLSEEETMTVAGIKTRTIFERYFVLKAQAKRARNLASGEKLRHYFETLRRVSPNDGGFMADTEISGDTLPIHLGISKPN